MNRFELAVVAVVIAGTVLSTLAYAASGTDVAQAATADSLAARQAVQSSMGFAAAEVLLDRHSHVYAF
jgi:hypothetical protein